MLEQLLCASNIWYDVRVEKEYTYGEDIETSDLDTLNLRHQFEIQVEMLSR